MAGDCQKLYEGKTMERIHGNLEATTLWVWYDLITGVGSDHDGIMNVATTHSQKTIGPAEPGGQMVVEQWMMMYRGNDKNDIS
jgi:hypothetical protein